jgi:hypothetical protein
LLQFPAGTLHCFAVEQSRGSPGLNIRHGSEEKQAKVSPLVVLHENWFGDLAQYTAPASNEKKMDYTEFSEYTIKKSAMPYV